MTADTAVLRPVPGGATLHVPPGPPDRPDASAGRMLTHSIARTRVMHARTHVSDDYIVFVLFIRAIVVPGAHMFTGTNSPRPFPPLRGGTQQSGEKNKGGVSISAPTQPRLLDLATRGCPHDSQQHN